MGQNTYGLLVTPFSQPGKGGTVNGFVLTAFFNARGSVILDESLDPSRLNECVSPCAAWGGRRVSEGGDSAPAAGVGGKWRPARGDAAFPCAVNGGQDVDKLSDLEYFGY